jgi:hypothetical protein
MTQANPLVTSQYIPGVCNINHAEIARRRMIGYIGTALFIVTSALLLIFGVTGLVRLVVFLPALMAASGFLQASHKFCSGYGGKGLQNAEEGSYAPQAVADASDAQKDKKRAATINLQSIGVAIIVTIIFLVIT